MIKLLKWAVGVILIVAFPFLLVVGAIWAVLYKIPMLIGEFLVDWVMKD